MSAPTPSAKPRHATASAHAVGIKETVISLLIAFALAFVFRGYVIEPFLIPTGSMAPTLLGAHERFVHPDTGYDWTVGPWYTENGKSDRPVPRQGGTIGRTNYGPITVNDPMSRQPLSFEKGVPSRSGDRIFVLKYVWPFFKPHRYDCVVFKNPGNTRENYIKRLIGLPNENIALVDGDVFVRKADRDLDASADAWKLDGWDIAPKPELVQRSTWQRVFDSAHTPIDAPNFVPPWSAGTDGWAIIGTPTYSYSGAGATTLRWTFADGDFAYPKPMEDADAQGRRAPSTARPPVYGGAMSPWATSRLDDAYPFNQVMPLFAHPNEQHSASHAQAMFFPVSDLRLSAAFEPVSAGESFAAVISARGHEFRGRVVPSASGCQAFLEMRKAPSREEPDPEWTAMAEGHSGASPAPGRPATIDFWHADQTLQLWIEGELVARETYHWTPVQRIEFSMGQEYTKLMEKEELALRSGYSLLSHSGLYQRPQAWFEISGPATLHRVAIWRDLYYQPAIRSQRTGAPSFATHPTTTPNLGDEEFFVCGDNSPASSDARLWEDVDSWVASEIGPKVGVVPERLLIGKAFFVYFPSLQPRPVGGSTIPVPDAGRLRWIW